MKTKFLAGLALLAVGATLRADDFSAQSLATNVRSDPRNAPAIVAMAAVENPRAITRVITAGVRALPRQTLAIEKAVLQVAPKQAPAIVRAAILAQPARAVEITATATKLFPDQAAAITKAALAVAPADAKEAIAGTASDSSSDDNLGESKASGGPPPAPSFPSQPVQPDLVSPSS